MTVIPDSLLKEDAVMISYLQKLAYGYRASFHTEVRRIRILSMVARDFFSNITVVVYPGVETLKVLDARTIKPNGKIVNLNQSDILKTGTDINGDGEFDYIVYKVPVPAVEIGDDIELILQKRIKHYPNYRFTRFVSGFYETGFKGKQEAYEESSLFNVYLHSELCCLHSEFHLQSSPEFRLSYKCYNGMPKPVIEQDSSRLLLKCSMNMIPALRDRRYSCMPCEVPYISFFVEPLDPLFNFNPSPRNWSDVYFTCINEFNPDDAQYWNKLNYFFNFYEQKIKSLSDSGSLYQFCRFYNYVKDKVNICPVHPNEEEYNIGYFLSGRYMDQRNLIKSYRKMLEYLKLPYYYCFVRPKTKGSFDMSFFREGEVTNVFLAFRDAKNSYHIIQPHGYNGTRYELDEVAPEYRGTTAVLVSRDDSLRIRMLIIPEHSYSENNSTVTGKVLISPVDSVLRITAKATFTGDYSTFTRNLWQIMDSLQNNPTGKQQIAQILFKEAGIDTLHLESYSSDFPYSLKLSYISRIKNKTLKLEDTLFNLPLEGIIRQVEGMMPSGQRKLGFYFPFAFTNSYKMMLGFDKPIEVLNADKFNITEENETASFSSSLSRINDKAYLLTVYYALKKSIVPVDDFPYLERVRKAADLIGNLSVFV